MKRFLVIMLILGFSMPLWAQTSSVDDSNFGLQISPFGAYAYNERGLADVSSLRIELGMELGIEDMTNPDNFMVYFIHHLSLEPRYYYNLKKRASGRKNTFGNSAEYVTLKTRLRPGYIFAENPAIYAIPTLSLIPSWGFRRVINEKLVVELGAGIGYRIFLYDKIYEMYDKDEISHLVVNLHCRFGIHFGTSKD